MLNYSVTRKISLFREVGTVLPLDCTILPPLGLSYFNLEARGTLMIERYVYFSWVRWASAKSLCVDPLRFFLAERD